MAQERSEQIKQAILANDEQLSVKFGIVALGMGGCSIGAEIGNISMSKIVGGERQTIYPYKTLLINTNSKDFDKLSIKNPNTTKKLLLDGYERGAGRDMQVGAQAIFDNREKVLREIEKQFKEDTDFIWIVAGLGGGTGTGSIDFAIRLLYNRGFAGKIGLIITLPMETEGGKITENAIMSLQKIQNQIKNIGAIVLVDNEKINDDYVEKFGGSANHSDFLKYCNGYVASVLHEMNVITANYIPLGRDHFDSSEFFNLIKQPGFISFVRKEFDDSSQFGKDIEKTASEIAESINKGDLSNGYDYKLTKQAAIALIANEKSAENNFTVDLTQSIYGNVMNKYAQFASEKPIATYSNDKLQNRGVMYAAFSGLNAPERFMKLYEQIMKYNEAIQEINKEKENDDMFQTLGSYTPPTFNNNNSEPANEAMADPFAFPTAQDDSMDFSMDDPMGMPSNPTMKTGGFDPFNIKNK